MGMKTEEKLILKGKRLDGRKPEDIRKVEMKVGVIPSANGSAQVRFGDTEVVAGVYGPRALFPKHLQKRDKAIIQCRYNMAPFSVEDRARPGPSRRSKEISKVTRLALEPALFLEKYPEMVVDVYIEVLQADGSTRVTGINAASLALADAGVPMKDLVVALSGGKINDTIIIDLCGKEDNYSSADVPIAFLPRKKEITLLQMDGQLVPEELKKILKIALKSGQKIYEKQKEVLKKRYEE
jgi:exosome complex component RRP41